VRSASRSVGPDPCGKKTVGDAVSDPQVTARVRMEVIGDRREAPVLGQRVENERPRVDPACGVRESAVGGCLGRAW
jgi:hypothetical protein